MQPFAGEGFLPVDAGVVGEASTCYCRWSKARDEGWYKTGVPDVDPESAGECFHCLPEHVTYASRYNWTRIGDFFSYQAGWRSFHSMR